MPQKNVYRLSSHKILIQSCKIHIRNAMAQLCERIFIRSHSINFFKCGVLFKLKKIQSRFQAVAKKQQHATPKCQRNNEKINSYCLLRLIRYWEKSDLSITCLFGSGDYQTRLKIFLQGLKLSWTPKLRHSTLLRLRIKLPLKKNQQKYFFVS